MPFAACNVARCEAKESRRAASKWLLPDHFSAALTVCSISGSKGVLVSMVQTLGAQGAVFCRCTCKATEVKPLHGHCREGRRGTRYDVGAWQLQRRRSNRQQSVTHCCEEFYGLTLLLTLLTQTISWCDEKISFETWTIPHCPQTAIRNARPSLISHGIARVL